MPAMPPNGTYTLAQAAARLGVADSTLRTTIRQGALPVRVISIGDRTLISRAELDALLGDRRQVDDLVRLCRQLDRMQAVLDQSLTMMGQMAELQRAIVAVATDLAASAGALAERRQPRGEGDEIAGSASGMK